MIINYTEKSMILPMSVIIFFSASKNIVLCRNDVQAIDFLRKGSYAPGKDVHIETYCDAWCLKVNTKKTKIIVFNKAGRKIFRKFQISEL